MKSRPNFLRVAVSLAASLFLVPAALHAADYTLAAGVSETISGGTTTYGTMTISGALTLNGGATVSASETVLGGNEGDSAGITISGSGSTLDSQKVTIGGASGGSGTITATGGGVVVIGRTSNNENRLTVASGAVPASGDVIDALVLGAGEHRIARLANSSGYPARILFAETGARLGLKTSGNSHWVNSFMSGNWILEATAPVEIRLECPPNHTLNDNGSKIITAGSGLFRVAGGSGTSKVAAEFGNTGGVTIDNGIKFTFANGKVDMSGLRGPLTINGTLGAGNNKVYGDGLVVGANGAVTTSSTQDFVFGSGDANGSLSATIPASNRVVKVGSGTLTVSGASSVGHLTISKGTVKVSAAFTVGTLELEEGAMLVVDDGIDFAPGAIVEHGAATITTLGTGRFIHESDSPCAIAKPSFGGSFVKTGTGTTSIYAPQSMPDALHVAEGGIVFSAYGLPQQFMRWTFSKTKTSPNPLQFSKLWVFGTDGSHVATGLTAANDNTTASLAAGKVCWEYSSETNIANQTSNYWEGKGIVYKMFSDELTSNQNNYPRLSSPIIDPENPNSWVSIVLRRKTGEANATGYNMRIANHIYSPSSWTVEVSDDGQNWMQVDSRTDVTPAKTTWWSFYDGKISASADDVPIEHFLFTGYKSDGLAADPAQAVTLQVDGGATADFTAFTVAPQKIDGLVVDYAAGGGTIQGGAIASEGTLTILNGAGIFDFGVPLPVTLTGVVDATNLRYWSLFVDGVERKGRIRLDANGHPVVVAFGTVVYFR